MATQGADNHSLKLRKAPSQERSRQTFEWILEAAAQIFEEKTYEEVTTNEIAERSGVSVGSIYQYFPSKDAILYHLLKQFSDNIFSDLQAVLQRNSQEPVPSVETVVQEMLLVMFERHLERPNLYQLCWQGTELSKELEAFKQEYHQNLQDLIRDFMCFHPHIYAPNPDMNAWILLHLVVSLFHQYIKQFSSFEDGIFFQELYRLILSYLSTEH